MPAPAPATASRSAAPTVLIDLPHTPARAALRAALMAMRVPPQTLPLGARERRRALDALAALPTAAAFIDISHPPGAPATGLQDLFSQVPIGEARRRVMLTRLVDGHVSEADRQWVREPGFADLLGEIDPRDSEGRLREAVDWAARHAQLPALAADELARFVRASVPLADQSGPRDLIRRRTGLAAEALVEQLGDLLEIGNRRWRLTTYPHCFVGNEAVPRMAAAWQCTRAKAVELGQALGRLGLLVHVVHQHPLLDEPLFYRLAWLDRPGSVSLGAAWETLSLPGGLNATTRSHLGRAYPDCWVGSEAVDLLCARHRLDRFEAWLHMHRLMQFGLFEHVVRERPFIDGEFFYRFAPTEPAAPSA